MVSAPPTAPVRLSTADDFRRLPLARLRCGESLRFPIHAADGMLLLAEGSLVTPRILEILYQRGYATVLVHRLEPSTALSLEPMGGLMEVPEARPGASVGIHNRATRQLDCELGERIAEAAAVSETPYLKEIPNRGTEPYCEKLARQIVEKHESFIETLQDSVQKIVHSDPRGQEQATDVVRDYLNLLVEDIDLFTHCASAPYAAYYPHRHSLHVAMISLAMGVRAGLGEEQLRCLGLGALLHDVGMLRIPRQIWGSKHSLSVQQQLAIMAHPIYSVDAVSKLDSIPVDTRYIIYQVHERARAQGYPRRVPAELIHPLAKIVSVADTYVAMLSERPYRPAIQPYAAIESLIRAVQSGRLEPHPVRLLLNTVSLYPVGSYVVLSDGRLGKVLRSNGLAYDRPVVRVWPPRSIPTDDTGELIDLLDTPDLKVQEAVPTPIGRS